MNPFQLLLVLALATLGSQTPARAAPIVLHYAVDHAGVSNVSLTLAGRTHGELPLPDGLSDQATGSVDLPIVPLAADGTLTVRWSEELSVSADLTVTLATVLSGMTIDVYFFDRTLDEAPTYSQVRKACLGEAPKDVRSAFYVLYTCREMAFMLEAEPQGHWDKPHLGAIQGWLVGNKYLFENFGWDVDAWGVPIGLSPYGADQGLVTKLRAIVGENLAPENWEPLRIEDAEQFLALVDDRALRLVGDVPGLIASKQYSAAALINDEAIKVLKARADQGSSRRLTVPMLEAQACFIKTKQNNGVPVPGCAP